jgi:4,5-dihydroxyphthalate decarboxylase
MTAPLITGFWNYDRTLPLIDKRILVEGYDLQIDIQRPEVIFARAFADAHFDVCEISFSNSVTALSKGNFPYSLVPIFLSRAFRHSSLFIRTDRGISAPENLKGKIVGVQEYDMTAAIVVRGFLREQYGVEPTDIQWKVGEFERTKPLEFPLGRPPDGVRIDILEPGKSLEARLLAGELDAVISLRPFESVRAKDPRVLPLFADPVSAERAWFKASRHFPIMHAVGVRKELLSQDPMLGRKLFDAFLAAKSIAIAEMEITQAPKITLPWPHAALAETRGMFGVDFWPYGIAANRRVLETQLRWSLLDGLQARPITIEELFDPNCLDT